MIISFLILMLMVLSTIGYGMFGLRLIGLSKAPSWAEEYGRAFALGIGTIGWIVFWFGIVGLLESWLLWFLLLPGVLSLLCLRSKLKIPEFSNIRQISLMLLVVLMITFVFDLLEATAPPIDADTLAYHFALPKQFLKNEFIEFVPIAVQGAIPLLTHMSYLLALGLGGELTLTLWTFTTQLFMALVLYGIGRRWLSQEWSLALVLVFLTTPAVIYGGGSGHMEVRLALYMLVGAISAAEGVKNRSTGLIILAGLMAGFFIGSKYYGLFAATGIGIIILMQKNFLKPILIYTGITIFVGCQWYVWNWWHSGIPVFPSLYHFMGSPASPYWNESINKIFTEGYGELVCVPANFFWMLWYPIATTLFPQSCWDSGRIGLGPYLLLLLPGVISAGWVYRRKLRHSLIFKVTLPAIFYYMLWFLIPSNQLTRQILPVYPLVLLGAIVCLERISVYPGQQWYKKLLTLSTSICVIIGMCIYSLFSFNNIKYHWQNETRDQFYSRNIGYYNVAQWINANLSQTDKVGNPVRYLNYLINIPYFNISSALQDLVTIHTSIGLEKLFSQLNHLDINYIIVSFHEKDTPLYRDNSFIKLINNGIAIPVQDFNTKIYSSRTFQQQYTTKAGIIKIDR